MRDLEEGAAYLSYLCSQHRRLRVLVVSASETLHELAAAPESRRRDSEVRTQLVELRRELRQHFDREKNGGCTEMAVSRLPRISSDVQKLRVEQASLLEELDHAIDRVACGQMERSYASLVDLSRRLQSWLSRESVLIAEAFGTDFADEVTC